MEDLIKDITPFVILFLVLLCAFFALCVAVKILTVMELSAERNAYNLIAEEEELEIKNKEAQEKRNKELHKLELELVQKQIRQVGLNRDRPMQLEKPLVKRTF